MEDSDSKDSDSYDECILCSGARVRVGQGHRPHSATSQAVTPALSAVTRDQETTPGTLVTLVTPTQSAPGHTHVNTSISTHLDIYTCRYLDT